MCLTRELHNLSNAQYILPIAPFFYISDGTPLKVKCRSTHMQADKTWTKRHITATVNDVRSDSILRGRLGEQM
jgi:hypothetical protein